MRRLGKRSENNAIELFFVVQTRGERQNVWCCWCRCVPLSVSLSPHTLFYHLWAVSHTILRRALNSPKASSIFSSSFSHPHATERRSSSRNDSYRYDKRGGSRRCGACLLACFLACLLAWCGMDTLERLSNFHTCTSLKAY
jgi:hypothetical protein